MRLDKWLWAARFFKTRGIATSAINGGKVRLNGDRPKPGKLIAVDDRLHIRRGHYEFDVVVVELSKQRGPATEAQQLYMETEESIKARQLMQEHLKVEAVYTRKDRHRPNKQERRKLIDIKRKEPKQ